MIEFTTVSADGTELAGRHWPIDESLGDEKRGTPPKAVMALVHGFGEHCGRYAHMAAHLNDRGIAVVAVDLHGHGKTPGPRGVIKNYDDFRHDLSALLEATRNFYPDSPLCLYGHSMGGGIVLDYGIEAIGLVPIISSSPFIRPAAPIPKPLEIFVRLMARIRPKGSITQPIDGNKISNLPDEKSIYLNNPLCHGTMGFRLAKAMVETGEKIATKADNWNRPLLLLHSKADQLTSYQASADFADTAKQVEFHGFETVQHEMHNDASRDKVYALMTNFILHQTEKSSA